MNIGTAFVSRCKALIRARYGSVNAFCSHAERLGDAPITRWQIINTLGSENPRIIQMFQISELLEVDLKVLLFDEEISLSMRGGDED